jgi:OOP family OmpA-OmpF porin
VRRVFLCALLLAMLATTAHALRILERIYFKKGSDVVQKEAKPILEAIAAVMKGQPEIKRVAVIGNASIDEHPVAMERFNLSVNRSRAVIEVLVSLGVERSRLVVAGDGSDKPLDTGKTELARQKNRRIEFLILERSNR